MAAEALSLHVPSDSPSPHSQPSTQPHAFPRTRELALGCKSSGAW